MGKAAAGDPPQAVKLSGKQTGCRWGFGKCRFPYMRKAATGEVTLSGIDTE